jgi:hypothetical protein
MRSGGLTTMLMNLLNDAGERSEAVLLAAGDYHLRIIFRGSKDTTELRLIKDQWKSENDKAVYIESLIPLAATNLERPRTMAAGQSAVS